MVAHQDLSKQGEFEYTEFLDKALQAKGYMVEVKLTEAFDSMESKEGRYISRSQLASLIGSSYEPLRIDDMFEGAEGDVKMQFQDFLHLFDQHIESLCHSARDDYQEYTPPGWGRT